MKPLLYFSTLVLCLFLFSLFVKPEALPASEVHIRLSEKGLMKARKSQPGIEAYIGKIREKITSGKVVVIISANSWQEKEVEKLKNSLLNEFDNKRIKFELIYSS
ncbi:hypothetical protein PRUB_b0342 [Pseudoalteromonas rubra]|uniref:Uncharacterized protein n=1 Tax=Pseudoalteromonas rubra TaxID=43658 RepID=A0A8T0C1J5_9GAMM|nr:hypothetical protein [Pseudoalteromonas rubra]KAF7781197.1 hypothetical protein PRUB_b0342 [Pseudoalteromonas rubra]